MKRKLSMRIKTFNLGSHTIKVKYEPNLVDPDNGAPVYGLADPKTNIIQVSTHMAKTDICEDVIFHSAMHEMTHMILMLMNEFDLNANEKFVDTLGGYIAQYVKSVKYGK